MDRGGGDVVTDGRSEFVLGHAGSTGDVENSGELVELGSGRRVRGGTRVAAGASRVLETGQLYNQPVAWASVWST
jgi:hypothetical protein